MTKDELDNFKRHSITALSECVSDEIEGIAKAIVTNKFDPDDKNYTDVEANSLWIITGHLRLIDSSMSKTIRASVKSTATSGALFPFCA